MKDSHVIVFVRCILIFVFEFVFLSSSASNWFGINSGKPKACNISIVTESSKDDSFVFSNYGFFSTPININNNTFQKISIPGCGTSLLKGAPELPVFSKSIIIPDHGSVKIVVSSAEYSEFANFDVIPSKGNLYRNESPSMHAFEFGELYQKDTFFPEGPIDQGEPYILRDHRGMNIIIHPVVYNPVLKVIRVYTRIEFTLVHINESSTNEFNRVGTNIENSLEFKAIYESHFLNNSIAKYPSLVESGSLLVISDSIFSSTVQPLIDWKTQRGIPTTLVNVQNIGADQTSIKNFIYNYFQNNGLTFVLIVGDHQNVPSFLLANGDAADPVYGHLVGNDSYAEVIVGRLSANTISELDIQIQKILNYEKYPDTSLTYYQKGVVVASDQGPGDDGEYDYQHARNMRADLLTYNYSLVDELYDGSQGGADAPGDPTSAMLTSSIQDGRSLMTYTGHGSSSGCSTTGFNISDVNNLSNYNRLPFILSVACVNGNFTGITCFAEALLRSSNNGQPTGAIATLMASINQSWNPPMDGQDEMIDLLCEVSANGYMRTMGGISVNGCMHMNDVYGVAGDEMTNTWHLFGDPSVVIRTNVPSVINANHANVITIGSQQFNVSSTSNGAIVTLSKANEIIATGTISNGAVLLNFNPILSLDTLLLTISGYNLIPYQAPIGVIPAGGPYVIYSNIAVNDINGNNNSVLDYGENAYLNLQLQNAGNTNSGPVTVTLSSVHPLVQIFTNTVLVSDVNALSTTNILSAFNIQVSDSIPDQSVLPFSLLVSGSLGSWTSNFTLTVNAPSLIIESLSIQDQWGGNGNGKADPGENVDLIIRLYNHGHSTSTGINSMINTSTSFISINNPSSTALGLAPSSYVDLSFNVSISSQAAPGDVFDVFMFASAGWYQSQHLFFKTIGDIVEDFESGDFLHFPWSNSGTIPWSIDSMTVFQGQYSSRSGLITHQQLSDLSISLYVPVDDSLSFHYSVSSEPFWDNLIVFVDSIEYDRFSGLINWQQASYLIPTGQHTIMFRYMKDGSVSTGQDCAWLDNIKLPVNTGVTSVQNLSTTDVSVMVYPNPVSDQLTVKKISESVAITSVDLYTLTGVKLSNELNTKTIDHSTFQIDLANWPAAIYLVQVNTNERSLYFKIQKSNK